MRDIQFPGRSVVMSTNGMVATSQPLATEAGLGVLRRGGNAMDAAIAACAVQCVTEPQSTGIGGDCFVLYHEAKTGKLHGLNGSGRAPARATLEAFRSRGLSEIPMRGILSVSVPGSIHAWETALGKFGTLGLDTLLQPAIDLAEGGFPVTPVVSVFWKNHRELLAATKEARAAYLPGGGAPAAGSRFRCPDLAASLRLVAEQGPRAFYSGSIAEAIVAYSRANDGLLEMEDLAGHQSEWVQPIGTDYRGLTLYEIPPNGQGITALMALNILEQLPLGEMEHLSADYIHTVVEAYKLATTERDRFVSDMQFGEVPIEALLAKDFARRQLARIDPARAANYPLASGLPEHHDTVTLSVVDRDRNAVSFINSLSMGFGSGLVAGNTGITLQNRGAGFVLEEGHFNCLAPGKRPLHTIIPAMAYRGGQPVLAFGVMGGFYQPMGHAYVLTNWLDFGMDLQQAIDAPRFLPAKGVLTVERGIPAQTRAELE
ncbi:MAG: gamma-glutamyltransferase, partial [bacterium]